MQDEQLDIQPASQNIASPIYRCNNFSLTSLNMQR